jgi:hypothetical protein
MEFKSTSILNNAFVAVIFTGLIITLWQWPADSPNNLNSSDFLEKKARQTEVMQSLEHKTRDFMINKLNWRGSDIIAGKENVLFYKTQVDWLYSKETSKKVDKAFKAIVNFKAFLDSRNIKLILMPTPVKAELEPSKLGMNELNSSLWQLLKKKLLSENVEIYDSLNTLRKMQQQGRQVFLKTDTHWTFQAMNTCAEELSRKLHSMEIQSGNKKYEQMKESVHNIGDIARLAPGYYKTESQEILKTNHVLDRHSEILLLGDSFSNIYSDRKLGWGYGAGLADRLAYTLNKSIDAILINNGGGDALRKEFSTQSSLVTDRLKNKKIIIWQFTKSQLLNATWQDYNYTSKDRKSAEFLSINKEAVISGTILERAPFKTAKNYRDQIISMRLTNLILNGEKKKKDLICMVLVKKKDKLLNTVTLRPGDKIEGTVIDWQRVPDMHRINRSELDSDEALLASIAYLDLKKNKSVNKKPIQSKTYFWIVSIIIVGLILLRGRTIIQNGWSYDEDK